jgi:D-arabinose 1-dehydrogenase-like Zn-dependent alcohol dehydrogenase
MKSPTPSIIPIRAAVLRQPGAPLRIESLEMEGPRDDELLVRIVASGICHTDIDFCEGGASGPIVLGHEGSGIVEKVGRKVKGFKAGDHLVLSYQSCGQCRPCRQGRPAHCERFWDANFGFARLDGTNALLDDVRGHFFGQSSFATHTLATARNVVKVPRTLPLKLLAPLGCGLQTGAGTVMNSLKVRPGASLAVFGVGSVGLAAVMAAHIVRAKSIIAVDIHASGPPGTLMKNGIAPLLYSIAITSLLQFSVLGSEPGQGVPAPVTADASPEAKALLQVLYRISGRYTLTGQHNYPNSKDTFTQRTAKVCGKLPAVFGQDFGFAAPGNQDAAAARPEIIAEVKRQHEKGSIITLCWHAVRPTDDEPVTFRGSVQGKLTEQQWNDLLTPGTELHKRWCAQVDVIAGHLKELQAAHIPVLWRPYHEMNGDWFWWGGRPGTNGTIALYRQLFDLKKDPQQIRNVAGQPEYNAAQKELQAQLDRWMRDSADPRAIGDDDHWDAYPYFGGTPASKTVPR